MMADDMGVGDTSAYLNIRLSPKSSPIQKTLRTPNLERLAQSGLLFTDGYAPASMCSATRYSLLTGRFAHRSYLKYQGWLPHGPNHPMIQRGLATLPEMLGDNGYRTACIGKYHVGIAFSDEEGKAADDFYFHDVDITKPLLDGPTHHGFDEFFGVPGNTEDPLDTEPRILIRNDRFTFTDRDRLKRIGMRKRAGKILAAPNWDLRQLGPTYLREAIDYIDRHAERGGSPFFLYYVPNANHFQRNPTGDYAVPAQLNGVAIKGQSRYSDETPASAREDMVLENDTALGQLLDTLQSSNDPRWPGHKLIENTLLIFTSDNGPNIGDNLGHNQESGGLRGKKAKLWEGGIRVPFIVSWPAVLAAGEINRSIVSLTDLYATLAHVVDHELAPGEALDSYDVLPYWIGSNGETDIRPRVFFCHLGPPFLNDALAIRQGNYKLIVNGGLAMPWAPWSAKGSRGASQPTILYDLNQDLFERDSHYNRVPNETAKDLAHTLLKIHNRGFARELNPPPSQNLILSPGWHNLRNDVTGKIGFEFQIRDGSKPKLVTHLGLWTARPTDRPSRASRAIPGDHESDSPKPHPQSAKKRLIKAPHRLQLFQVTGLNLRELRRIDVSPGQAGLAEGAFRYFTLESRLLLAPKTRYVLTMSTRAADGDPFHDPASFDGLPPLVHPEIQIERSLFIPDHRSTPVLSIPTFEDLSESYSRYRLPVGPSMRFDSR